MPENEKQYIADAVKAAASPSGIVLAAVVLICVLGVMTVKLFFDMTLNRLDKANDHADKAVSAMEDMKNSIDTMGVSAMRSEAQLERIASDLQRLLQLRQASQQPAAYTPLPKNSTESPFY